MAKKAIVRAFSSDQETEKIFKAIKKRGLNISRTIRSLVFQFAKNGYDFHSISFVQFNVDEETDGYIRYAKDTRAVDMDLAFKKFMKQFADDDYKFKAESEGK